MLQQCSPALDKKLTATSQCGSCQRNHVATGAMVLFKFQNNLASSPWSWNRILQSLHPVFKSICHNLGGLRAVFELHHFTTYLHNSIGCIGRTRDTAKLGWSWPGRLIFGIFFYILEKILALLSYAFVQDSCDRFIHWKPIEHTLIIRKTFSTVPRGRWERGSVLMSTS